MSAVDGWGRSMTPEALDKVLADAPPGSDWWFDRRDLFHKPEGTNLDHAIIPLPETWHESQAVPSAVGELVAVAVNYLRAARRCSCPDGYGDGSSRPHLSRCGRAARAEPA